MTRFYFQHQGQLIYFNADRKITVEEARAGLDDQLGVNPKRVVLGIAK